MAILLFACLWSTGIAEPVSGQTTDEESYTLVLRGVPMNQALEQLVRLTKVDLVYNSDLVAGKHVYCSAQKRPTEALLQCVLAGSGLDYVRSSAGTYVLMEALRQLPRYGNLAGRVVDARTQEPLPNAHVFLADASTGTASSIDGLFSFPSVQSGLHRIVATYVGYETAVDSVWVEPGAQQHVQITLRPTSVALEPVIIDGLAQRLPSSGLGLGMLTQRQLSALRAEGTPDVARGASHLPGIALQQPLADLHIQGGAVGEHLMRLDGVPVRSPVSLGRHLSAFSPLAIDRLTIHKAGFGAEHGSYLSGVVDVKQDVAGTGRPFAVVSADPVSINGKLQHRFTLSEGREGTLMLAARRSLWDTYRDPGINDLLRHWNAVDPTLASLWIDDTANTASLDVYEHRPDVAFSDVHAAARMPLSPFRTLYASVYRARNHIASDLTAIHTTPPSSIDNRLLLTHDTYDWTNWAAQVRHHWLLGARSVATVQAQGSWHTSRYTYYSRQGPIEAGASPARIDAITSPPRDALDAGLGSEEYNKINEVALHATLNHSLSPHYHGEVGLTATHVDTRFQFENPFIAPFTYEASPWEFSGYAKGTLAFGLRTTLEPSLRLTYLPTRRTVYAEPRLALRYDGPSSPVGPYAVRLATGLYRQFINPFELSSSGSTSVVPSVMFWVPVERSLAPPRAYHLAADVLLLPHAEWTIQLEGYYKEQPRLLTLDYARLLTQHPSSRPQPDPIRLDPSAFIAPTRGRSYGSSVRIQGTVRALSGTASYSYSRALRRFPSRFDDRLVPAPWNVPHRLLLDARATLTSAISVNLSWQGGWGQRWAFRNAYYDYLALRADPASFAPFDLNHPADQRLDSHSRLDAGVAYERSLNRVSVQIRAFIVNVLDRRNVFDWSLEQTNDGPARVNRVLPGRHPVIAIRIGY